jgi:hypothetical protein
MDWNSRIRIKLKLVQVCHGQEIHLKSSVVDPDLHHFGNLDPHQIKIRIRIRINLQMTSQNVWNISLFEHFLKSFAFIWKLGSGSGSASG